MKRFKSYFLGGFECSTHRRRDGRRLDIIAATNHDTHACEDYARLAQLGILMARDGLRWHLIEPSPRSYDFSSLERQVLAAARADVEVIWDLFHYGYPEGIDIFSNEFASRLADLGAAFAEYHIRTLGKPPMVIPVNEISFFAWIAGDIGRFYPFAVDRGDELKRSLIAAYIAASRAVRSAANGATILASEPLVHVTARTAQPHFASAAEEYRLSQYQALDMLTGRIAHELGGGPDIVDVLGVNYYPHNQWYYPDREMIPLGDERYRPFNRMLSEAADRYNIPIFVSETGTEDGLRVTWFKYVVEQCRLARESGVDLRGICLYPIVNHPGWEDERHCHNGLWDYCAENGRRQIFEPLAAELRREIAFDQNSRAISAS